MSRAISSTLELVGLQPRYDQKFKQLLQRKGFPSVERSPFHGLGVGTDELVLFPEAFAHLGGEGQAPRIHHAGPCIDLERQQQPFPWERLEEGRPLVLFSMGTRGYTSDLVPRLIEATAEAAAQRPQWQFVLGVSASADPAAYDARTPNLIAVRSFPQLALLQRASAMITHAGFNTVKECIWAGVPMVALPLMLDQPLIARIAEKHGLGVRASPQRTRAPDLMALLDKVVEEPSYRHAVSDMSARFREAERPESLRQLIDPFLREGRRAPTRPLPTNPSVA